MFCPNCGTQNDDNAAFCAKCGGNLKEQAAPAAPQAAPAQPQFQAAAPAPQISNYLVQSILVTLFCCLPLGVVAIIFAAQVNGKLAAGDVEGAKSSAKTAKTLCWVSFGGGLAFMILYVILMVLGIAAGSAGSSM